ncbi:presequence protease, mitochondrial [Daktulosphaira vitifoliae]|uniref:presequence protease, mitochondrial n=1 Tax=Daktulosphaira vitifoliae TaxID=58002 RepID=UPI0021AB03D8|nr:presequence protease, mitochondrial [Daktulosphaira vitifoliae]XP_050535718.1 presequence protease, mitochondrial [Daktulosphaira vitifoliae]XP_050535719.1 presequence protease, mitochondrial [Daktulosphaira vitifoliae]
MFKISKSLAKCRFNARGLSILKSNTSSLTNLEEGQDIEGFEIKEIKSINDLQLTALRLEHKQTKADYLHIDRKDTNNVFSVAFRTTPTHSNGLPHILEHTTLCGSKNFPCRDPFFKMLNRSMANFMNAMTAPDYTFYPFCTENHSDYYNLMAVYLDAVFNPMLRDSDFRQEGWRLEHTLVEDKNSPIEIKGVVYNEMKGVYSDNQQIYNENFLNQILPSNTYGVNSGGDPNVIPSLTHSDLVNFHNRYYHPSNARFYSYGSFNLSNHLQFLNEKFLHNYSADNIIKDETKVPNEKRWTSYKRSHVFCREDPMIPKDKQSSLSIGTLWSDITNTQETFELAILSRLLLSGPNAKFYKSLIEPNIGTDFSSPTGYTDQTKDTFFAVGLQGINESDFDKVESIYDETIKSVIKNGFDQRDIENILHSVELSMRHQSSNFGLNLLYGLLPVWNHEGNVVDVLNVGKKINIFKQNMTNDSNYLQSLMNKYLLNNKHKLIMTMSPNQNYEVLRKEAENNLLKEKLLSLSAEDKENIYYQGLELRKEQDAVQDASCLPSLTINDLKKTTDSVPLKKENFSNTPIFIFPQSTNQVTYFKSIINTSMLPENLKSLIPLFCNVVTRMGTISKNYKQFDQLIRKSTGGLGVSQAIIDSPSEILTMKEIILLNSHCLDKNVDDMFDLWTQIFTEVAFKDENRFKTLIQEEASSLANSISGSGHVYAMLCATSAINPIDAHRESYGGLKYISKMKEIAHLNDLLPVLKNLKDIGLQLLNKNFMKCSITIVDNNIMAVKSLENFINNTHGNWDLKNEYTKVLQNDLKKNCFHHVLPFSVNYCAKALPGVPYTHKHFAALKVLCKYLSSKYLLPTVREKNGAYGAGVSVSSSGSIQMYSYRDPKPVNTFEAFDNISQWINKRNISSEELNEAKLAVFQGIDHPIAPMAKGNALFLYDMTEEIRQNHRMQVLNVKLDDLVNLTNLYFSNKIFAKALIGPKCKEINTENDPQWVITNHE